MTFEMIAEIEPPVNADAARVDAQVDSWRGVASAFLVPDNHTSRATVSSLVVAGELARPGLRSVACLNARDRNLLGLHRDLLTARYLGVNELLLVHGDTPDIGERAGGMSVRTMRDAVRFDRPVYAGVMVLPSAAMARRLGVRVKELRMPDALLDELERDPAAGVRFAARTIDDIRHSGAFAGVHVVGGARHRALATELTRERTVRQ